LDRHRTRLALEESINEKLQLERLPSALLIAAFFAHA
jgi:hypothetical protein